MPDRPGGSLAARVGEHITSGTAGTFGALRHRDFRRVWGASFVSMTGDWFQIAARSFLVYRITGSTAALGAIYFFSFVPLMTVSQVGGVLADRYDRRRLLIATQALNTVGACAFGVLAQTGSATMVNLSALSVVYGCISAIGVPVQQAVVPTLVPRDALTSAVGLQSSAGQSSRIVGPLLAGLLLPLVGAPWLFYLNAISFAFVIAAWWITRLTYEPEVDTGSAFGALMEGARYAVATRSVGVPLVLSALSGGLGLSYAAQMVAYADLMAHGHRAAAAHDYGLIQATFGIGAMVGVLAMTVAARRDPARTLTAGIVGFTFVLAAFGVVHGLAVFPVAMALAALQYGSTTQALNLLQHNAPEQLRGRIVALYTLSTGIFPVTGLVFGFAASRYGLRPAIVGLAALILAVALPVLRGRRHLQLVVQPLLSD